MMDHRLMEAEAKLTPLQRELLSLIGEGKTDHQIAQALNIDEVLMKAYITAMLCKLGVNTAPPSPCRRLERCSKPHLAGG